MSMIEALSSAGIPQKEFTRMLNVVEEEREAVKHFGIKIDGESLRRFCIYGEERQANQFDQGNSETEPE